MSSLRKGKLTEDSYGFFELPDHEQPDSSSKRSLLVAYTPMQRSSVRLTCLWPVLRELTSFVTAELGRRYKTEGINAYVDLIQNKERELGVDIITHQKWSVSVPPPSSIPRVAHMRQIQEWSQLH